MISAAVSNTPYMWMENTVLRRVSLANTEAALSRMVKDQSWPQFGASTISVWVNPAARSLPIAVLVSAVHAEVFVLPHGSLPMLRMV